ncbi:Serpin domain [Dillenia turbinata]|uniref:Serpin domain n=1 Tax=Dillenia turbinata TaxID=194707 RepID=A0AAN8WAE6_9MAGN
MECPQFGLANCPFVMKMVEELVSKQVQAGSNFVFSPLSFQAMMSLVAAGSSGCTLQQLLWFLGLKSIADLHLVSYRLIAFASPPEECKKLFGGPLLSLVSSVWLDKSFPLRSNFEEIAEGIFRAEAKQTDFSAEKGAQADINSWMDNASKGLIRDIIPSVSLDKETALIFANAMYFKGTWARRFKASKTETRIFHLLNGEIMQGPFIRSKKYEKHLYKSFKNDFKILKLPYQNNKDSRCFAMYFFLPEQIDGLQSLVCRICSDPQYFNQQFDLREEIVPDFWLPRFKISHGFQASEILKEQGLILPFTEVGEMTEIHNCPNNKLYVSEIFHKSCVEISEKGTDGVPRNAAGLTKFTASYPTPSFVADHPFLFMIREEISRIVFFLGAVINPFSSA